MDSNEKLAAAFQIECVEHLEAIRASLAKLDECGTTRADADLDDAFRRAHSLKGAARITGATVAEQLAHALESLFAHLKRDQFQVDQEIVCCIRMALDAIEDSAIGFANKAEPEIQHILEELHRLNGSMQQPKRTTTFGELDRKLRAAFEEEYRGYLAGVRSFIEKTREQEGRLDAEELDEAFRCAHTLKAAARLANVPGVDLLAQWLECLFSQARHSDNGIDSTAAEAVRKVLAAIDDCAAAPPRMGQPQVMQLLDSLPQQTAVENTRELAAANISASAEGRCQDSQSERSTLPLVPTPGPVETVRLHAQDLDRLLQSAGELLVEGQKQEVLTQKLNKLSRQVSGLGQHWTALKKATSSVRHLAATPEVSRIRQGLDAMEHQLQSLLREARAARLLQQRNTWSLRLLSGQLQRDVQRTRMIPTESIFQGFRKMVRDLARDEGKQIEFRVSGFEVEADRMVLQALKDSVMHALRNAVTHGIELPEHRQALGKPAAGHVLLSIQALGPRLTITVEDDGRGIDTAKAAEEAVKRRFLTQDEVATCPPQELARILFQPGLSTAHHVTELSGRGIGLSVVHEAVLRLQGDVELRPRPGGGTVLSISVPLAVSTHRLLLVSCQGQTFAIPLYGIESLHRFRAQDVETVEGKPMVKLAGQLISVTTLPQLLGMEDSCVDLQADTLSIVVLRWGRRRIAVVVDALLAERDSLIKSLGPPATALSRFSGGILLEDGTVALVVNPADLIQHFLPSAPMASFSQSKVDPVKQSPTILVVDDSFTTRTLETSILETHGYRVSVAVDGVEALKRLRSEKIDLVITDIQMPHLDGFGLLEAIKKDTQLAHIPVIIVSSVDQPEEQQRGLNLGADAYIVKRKFDHQDLLQTIEQVL